MANRSTHDEQLFDLEYAAADQATSMLLADQLQRAVDFEKASRVLVDQLIEREEAAVPVDADSTPRMDTLKWLRGHLGMDYGRSELEKALAIALDDLLPADENRRKAAAAIAEGKDAS